MKDNLEEKKSRMEFIYKMFYPLVAMYCACFNLATKEYSNIQEINTDIRINVYICSGVLTFIIFMCYYMYIYFLSLSTDKNDAINKEIIVFNQLKRVSTFILVLFTIIGGLYLILPTENILLFEISGEYFNKALLFFFLVYIVYNLSPITLKFLRKIKFKNKIYFLNFSKIEKLDFYFLVFILFFLMVRSIFLLIIGG